VTSQASNAFDAIRQAAAILGIEGEASGSATVQFISYGTRVCLEGRFYGEFVRVSVSLRHGVDRAATFRIRRDGTFNVAGIVRRVRLYAEAADDQGLEGADPSRNQEAAGAAVDEPSSSPEVPEGPALQDPGNVDQGEPSEPEQPIGYSVLVDEAIESLRDQVLEDRQEAALLALAVLDQTGYDLETQARVAAVLGVDPIKPA